MNWWDEVVENHPKSHLIWITGAAVVSGPSGAIVAPGHGATVVSAAGLLGAHGIW